MNIKHLKYCLAALLLLGSVNTSAQEEAITDTTKLSYGILFYTYHYYRVNYTYQSVAPDGHTPVTLSSALVFPEDVFEHKKKITVDENTYDASGLMLNNHYTITRENQSPTQTSEMKIEGPLAIMGPSSIIISPDGYGFGATIDKPQAYLMADATARNHIDAVKAARRLLSKMGYTYGDLFTQIGYSQGGHSTVAVQRYVDTHEVDEEGISHIDYSFCGAGPYDISAMLDTLLLPNARYVYPCAIPLIVEGQISGAGLDVDYSDFFPKPLDTKVVQWLDSKKMNTDTINDSIYATVGGNSKTGVLVSDILNTDNLQRSNTGMQPFFDAVADNTLVSGWRPNDHTRFYLYHSDDDEIVPYFNMEHLEAFLRNDCGLTGERLETYSSSGSHEDAAVMFVVNAISKLKQMEEAYLDGKYVPASIARVQSDDSFTSSLRRGWYNLQGQQLPARPHASGIYIHNGKKVIIGR